MAIVPRLEDRSTIRIYEDKIDEVATRISEKTDIPIDKAKSILEIGMANAIMLHRFRRIDDDI